MEVMVALAVSEGTVVIIKRIEHCIGLNSAVTVVQAGTVVQAVTVVRRADKVRVHMAEMVVQAVTVEMEPPQ